MNPNCPAFQLPAGLGRTPVLLATLAIAGARLAAADTEAVAISSTAAPFYQRATDDDGKPLPETYVFNEGHFWGGGTADASQTQLSFGALTRYLATNLAKQNYFPSRELASANLLIAVHWGTTLTYEDPRGRDYVIEKLNKELPAVNEAVAETGMADTGALNQALSDGESNALSQGAFIARNAALLGYARDLNKERRKMVPSMEELTMSTELNEERYFVVLMAYDYQFMRKEKKPKLLWVTRLSVRSPGNNFTEAMPILALAGADVFGRQLDGLTRVKVPVQSGTVKLHELQVLGTEEKIPAVEQPAK
ncbi:MAG TPA: hypothetical protein VG734_16100 [Lacunisphaera sp.]|nr:hypothetical protein [Lacunisphaera sp.]